MDKETREMFDSIDDSIFTSRRWILGILVIVSIISISFLWSIYNNTSITRDFPVEGYVEVMSDNSLLVNGETYFFCDSRLVHVRVGDKVRIKSVETFWLCGEVLIYSQDKSICNKDREHMEVRKW